jgi:integrase
MKVRREGYCPAAVRRQRPITVRDLSRRYLEQYAKANKRSWATDAYRLKPILAAVGDRLVTDLRAEIVEQYKTERLEAKRAPGTVNREVALLRKMLSLAVEWQLLERHPLAGVKALQEPPGRTRYLAPEEILALLAACDPHLRPIVVCALNTGLRRDEILGLTWDQVDLRQRMIRVTKTKSGKARAIPINDPLLDELRRLPRRLGVAYVFVNLETGTRYVDIKKAFTAAVVRAGLSDFRLHDCRHTFATYIQAGLGDLRVTQTLLGHADVRMTVRYSHVSDARLRDAVAVLPKATAVSGSGTQSGTGA